MVFDSHRSVIEFLESVLGDDMTDYADSYGEPGYSLDETALTPLVVFGSYWCRCTDRPQRSRYGHKLDTDKLHTVEDHYPRSFDRLESQGVEFQWHDEWTVDHENSKAYRTQPDSYSWKPSLIITDVGEYLTPDDDLDIWVDYVADNPRRAIPGHIYAGNDLAELGFDQFNGDYESGWHPGQDDNPETITDQIKSQHGQVQVVFVIEHTGQFDLGFTAWFRSREDETD